MKSNKKNQTKRPPDPTGKKVFKNGKLYYTIMKATYIEKGHPILKQGWLTVKKYNFDHPLIKKKIADTNKRQDEIMERKNLSYDDLHKNIYRSAA